MQQEFRKYPALSMRFAIIWHSMKRELGGLYLRHSPLMTLYIIEKPIFC